MKREIGCIRQKAGDLLQTAEALRDQMRADRRGIKARASAPPETAESLTQNKKGKMDSICRADKVTGPEHTIARDHAMTLGMGFFVIAETLFLCFSRLRQCPEMVPCLALRRSRLQACRIP